MTSSIDFTMEENPNLAFGTITIMYNHGIIDSIWKTLFDYETPNEYSDLIISFDEDGSIISKENIETQYNITISDTSCLTRIPLSITTKNKIYHSEIPKIQEGTYRLNFTKIFGKFIPNFINNAQASIYNCIYYYLRSNLTKIPAFSIIKQKYGHDSERYTFVYDYTVLTKEEIAFIIKNIFFPAIQ
jgi:hypothetical protein